MCDFLYGVVNRGINQAEFMTAIGGSQFYFTIGDKKDVNMAVEKEDLNFRIKPQTYCDCDTAFGTGYLISKEIDEFLDVVKRLSKVTGIEYIYVYKKTDKERSEKEEKIYYEDLDFKYMSEIEDNCLYKIELKKRYY